MKNTELRIGNIVALNNPKAWAQFKGRYCSIEQIGVNMSEYWVGLKVLGELTISDKAVGELSQFLEYIEPVLLTPDILEKCGFVKVVHNSTIDFHGFRNGNMMLYRIDRSSALSPNRDWCYEVEYGFTYEERAPLGTTLDYLHQLQNLYFCLTGQELTITL